jgi:hypothetical protein
MATLKMEVHGLAELLAGLEKLGQDMTGALDDVVNATGLELRGDIIKRYQRGPASGGLSQVQAEQDAPSQRTGASADDRHRAASGRHAV